MCGILTLLWAREHTWTSCAPAFHTCADLHNYGRTHLQKVVITCTDLWEQRGRLNYLVIYLPSSRKRVPWNPEWMHLCVFLVPSSSQPRLHGPVCIFIKASVLCRCSVAQCLTFLTMQFSLAQKMYTRLFVTKQQVLCTLALFAISRSNKKVKEAPLDKNNALLFWTHPTLSASAT